MKFAYTLLYVDDVEKTLNFYTKAFGLEVAFLHESQQYGEMKCGETKLGFVQHETASSHGFDYTPANLASKPFAIEIGFVTADVQAAFDKAVQAGATAISHPIMKPWGQIVSYVRDCNGFLVEICSEL